MRGNVRDCAEIVSKEDASNPGPYSEPRATQSYRMRLRAVSRESFHNVIIIITISS